jgi:hypothetical protein
VQLVFQIRDKGVGFFTRELVLFPLFGEGELDLPHLCGDAVREDSALLINRLLKLLWI